MRSKLAITTCLLALGLLSACGGSGQSAHTSGHGPGDAEGGAAEHAGGGHAGHGGDTDQAAADVQATFSFAGGAAKAGERTELTVQVSDPHGKPVNDFQVSHEKLLHLIVVSRDLTYFNHIHPEYKGGGTFTVATTFPAGGDYKLFADFIPTGRSGATLSRWVKIEGKEEAQDAIAADAKLVKEAAGKQVELALGSTKAKEDVTLTFTIRDAKTMKGIDSLEPYLGAVGHVVILSADAEQYIHVHPLDEKAKGPKAQFAASFPKSGTYKIWGQFQHKGEVFTVPFVVDVK